MKNMRYLLIVSLILTVVTIGAVSAADNSDALSADDSVGDVSESSSDVNLISASDNIGGGNDKLNHGSDNSSYLGDEDSEDESAVIEMPEKVEYGEEKTINISLPANATGNLVVYNGTYNESSYAYDWKILENISLTDGKAAYDVYRLPLGNYYLKAIYDGDDYEVSAAEHEVNIVPAVKFSPNSKSPFIYENLNDYAEIILPSDTNRTLIVSIKEYYTRDIIEELFNASTKGNVKITIPKLDYYTSYFLSVSYGGVENEKRFYYTDWVVISETAVDRYNYDNYAYVHLVDFQGYVQFFIDGKLFDVKTLGEIERNYALFSLKDVAMGNHTYEFIYFDNNNVKQLNKSGSFKKDYDIDINYGHDTYSWAETYNIPVRLPKDAAGTVTVNSKGKNYTANINNGYAGVYVDNLVYGENNITVIYSGDSKYPSRQIKKVINVNGYAVYAQYDEDSDLVYISLILPENAKGNLTVYDSYGDVIITKNLINGTAKILKSDFKYGVYNVASAEYDEDDFNVEACDLRKFSVLPEMNIPEEITVGDKLPVSINIPGADGYILVSEEIYNSTSDYFDKVLLANITSNNGLFETNISGLKFGNHRLILEYAGNYSDNFFEGGSFRTWVLPLKYEIPETGKSDGSVEITLQLPEGLSGTVYVYDDDNLIFNGSYLTEVIPV